jgi:hypothetical protein
MAAVALELLNGELRSPMNSRVGSPGACATNIGELTLATSWRDVNVALAVVPKAATKNAAATTHPIFAVAFPRGR